MITQFVLAGGDEIADYNGEGVGVPWMLTVRGVGGLPVAAITPATSGQTESVAYYHHDVLGSTVAATQAGASGPAEVYVYSEFGEPAGGSFLPYQFAGYRYDNETGLYYVRARYYSPGLGRFLQPDPIGVKGGTNLYAYVNNDPINGTDPLGLCALSDESEQALLNSSLTGPQSIAFENAVLEAANRTGVDPNLIVGLAFKESAFDPMIVNGEARGLFQITPGQQNFLHLTDAQVTSVTGAISAVADYFDKYIGMFTERKGNDVGEDLAIASWTMGVQHTLNVYNQGGIEAVRNTPLGDPQNHRVGNDYIDAVQSFETPLGGRR